MTSAASLPEETFDVVIVGGGTAGCILANRLSADPCRTVLLLEAGGEGRHPWISIPAGFSKLLSDDRFNRRFRTEPEQNVNGRSIVVPRGKGLGGSTLINGMIYVRGQPQDFNGWAQMGATGWSFADVLPYFLRLEDFEEGGELRGRGGPVRVERVKARNPLADAFIAAGGEAGWPVGQDYNGTSQDGFGYYQVTQRGGVRVTASGAYLDPVRKRPNLTVRTRCYVTRIEFDGRRARGVTYRSPGGPARALAAREIVLAAGAVQTPHLLELSGVGDPEVLARAGLPVVHALMGVGNNYIDHFCTRMNWRVKVPITLNELTRGWRLALAVGQYSLTRTGILTLGTGLAHGFVRTQPMVESPDVQFFFMHASYADAATRRLDSHPGMTIGVTQLRPQSRGTIHAENPDPDSGPAIRPNFLSATIDQDAMVNGMRLARHVVNQPAMAPFRDAEMNPGDAVQSHDEWLDFARSNGQTIYHPVGTCRMGTAPGCVVDPSLRVHGLANLRVADASVMPAMVSANTAAATMMIAEKAADLITKG